MTTEPFSGYTQHDHLPLESPEMRAYFLPRIDPVTYTPKEALAAQALEKGRTKTPKAKDARNRQL